MEYVSGGCLGDFLGRCHLNICALISGIFLCVLLSTDPNVAKHRVANHQLQRFRIRNPCIHSRFFTQIWVLWNHEQNRIKNFIVAFLTLFSRNVRDWWTEARFVLLLRRIWVSTIVLNLCTWYLMSHIIAHKIVHVT